jgi:hypothetical protein
MSDRVQTIPLTTTMVAAAPYVPPLLVDAAARQRIEDITNQLPAALTRRTYLECRLAERAAQVDLVFCVDSSSRILLMDPRPAWLPSRLRTHPLWSGLGRLCAHWADPGSQVGAAIYDLWLEFDAIESPAPADGLVPSVFVGLARTVATPPLDVVNGGLRTLETLLNRPVSPSLCDAVRHVVDRLPAGASVPYVGVMYPRSATTLRLCVSPLAGLALLDYLRAIAWPGDIGRLAALLRAIPCDGAATALERTTLLHVDVEDGVLPRIGLELPLPQYPQPMDGPSERVLFEALCAHGLCSAAKCDALRRWPGYTVEQFPHQCWPSLAIRRVSHVKVVYEPGRGAEIKTYLSFFHDFLPRATRLATRKVARHGLGSLGLRR